MAEYDRDRRPGGTPDGQRAGSSGPRRGQPPRDGSGKPPRAGGGKGPVDRRASGPVDRRAGNPFDGKRLGGERGGKDREMEDRDPYGIKAVRNRHDDPELPDDVQAKDLDRVARAQLKTLSKENADDVARHLAMVARLIEEDAQLAYRHAVSAARRAGRIAIVRETLAIAAYSIGDFALALRELRTYRRISGNNDQLPMMVDSERGMGRPDKALELGRSVPRETLPVEVQVELAIAMSGARLDLEQADRALAELEIAQLDPDTAFSWSPALFDAYATVLEELGRDDEAEEWWQRSDRAQLALEGGSDGEDETVEIIEEDVVFDESADDDAPADTPTKDSAEDEGATDGGDTDISAGAEDSATDGRATDEPAQDDPARDNAEQETDK
ncbi:tetratricopeptide repeat protein [Marisediminicola senii]|uniref:tetratricopeptide repeat protein n=1 Tax=Marisediminicola senii TaxID=2711233 RepID=UPI001F3FC220|nr:hypothetical protein [Marisediminicola senii]